MIAHNVNFAFYMDKETLIGTKKHDLNNDNPLHITKFIGHISDLYDDIDQKVTEINKFIHQKQVDEILEFERKTQTLFWKNSFIKMDNNPYYEELLNYNIFMLNRQGGEHFKHNIAAKGISGEGYEGHTFWDTEIYMLPFFILTNPHKAKNLLMYRYHTLSYAKQEARNLGYRNGVKIPWRTINGMETSPYYPAGSAQFHINSDIAYAVIKYFQATNDIDFLVDYGFEIIVETARFLIDAVNFHDGYYHLNSVTGPDEYSTVVDDNFYTNYMFQYHLKELLNIHKIYNDRLVETVHVLKLTQEELLMFQDVCEKIYLTVNENKFVIAQDKNFFARKKLDLTQIPREKFPLLMHFHPLFLYKHQVLKQADTVLALMLQDYDNLEVLENTFRYYEPITTHDSSLSKCIYSIIAFRLDKMEIATKYLKSVIETDYLNTHGNTKDGLHVANLGGSYLGFISGLVGLHIHEKYISIRPKVIDQLQKYSFHIMYQGKKVQIDVSDVIEVTLNGTINMKIYDETISIENHFVTKLV